MPRVETIVRAEIETAQMAHPPALLNTYIQLRADQIQIAPLVAKARSGPVPANEQKKIEALALSMRTVGQLVPCVVEQLPASTGDNRHSHKYQYQLIDGWRRLKAATHINQTVDPGFELACVVRETDADPLRAAVHANLKRRGLSPLQFAYLCRELRELHGWTGTREIADYLQVSRATVSQHDKLLSKPAGMDDATYGELLDKVANGRMGAEAAFELLTHVEPTRATEVLERAEEKAEEQADQEADPEIDQETAETSDPPSPTTNGSTASPTGSQLQEPASYKPSKTPRNTPQKRSNGTITRTHVRQAAQETGAVVQPTARTIPELRKLFEEMRSPIYPDVMRSLVSMIAGQWWRGDAKNKDVLAIWAAVAKLVAEAESIHQSKRGPRRHV